MKYHDTSIPVVMDVHSFSVAMQLMTSRTASAHRTSKREEP